MKGKERWKNYPKLGDTTTISNDPGYLQNSWWNLDKVWRLVNSTVS